MKLYTLVLDFHGGTYISQFDAATLVEAVVAWSEELKAEKLLGDVSAEIAEGVRRDAVENHLVPIEGLQGVWCASALAGDQLALLNVIATQRAA